MPELLGSCGLIKICSGPFSVFPDKFCFSLSISPFTNSTITPINGIANIAPKSPNNWAPIVKLINTKTGDNPTSFLVIKGVITLFSIC